ncbi:hypothetical protein CK203_008500 [Vitis vinifera]|uniref:Uncharacterized protein n=1 Tax=Vitis vinifera TaxID=29760 RepID=A0A438KP83_VITVI|nr:hypothetical protein CK203_008500 [Vitis vinifera]
MLSIPCANFTGMRTLCEPYANSFFCANFQNHALCLGESQIPYEESICHVCGPSTNSTSESSYKEAKTSEPGESSRAPRDSQSQPSSARRPRPACPLRATPIADRETFMSRHISITLLCDNSLSCGIHTAYLRGTILYPFMILPQFFLSSSSFRLLPVYDYSWRPADPATFRRWAPLSEWDMVRILSRGTSSQMTILRRELPPEMLLVDVVLRANLFPLQHKVQRRGAIMEALFRISEGYYFGSHHLIMAALLHFEEKVHTRRLARVDSMPLLFPRLLCHVLAHMDMAPSPVPSTSRAKGSPSCSVHFRPPQPVPEAASSDAPPVVPPTSESPITIPGPEYRALLASFQTLTTTQTAIMERMDHFQLQQDQQTLILHEIQHHLGLSPPAPPVAVPSTVAGEDPSYPPEEPTT